MLAVLDEAEEHFKNEESRKMYDDCLNFGSSDTQGQDEADEPHGLQDSVEYPPVASTLGAEDVGSYAKNIAKKLLLISFWAGKISLKIASLPVLIVMAIVWPAFLLTGCFVLPIVVVLAGISSLITLWGIVSLISTGYWVMPYWPMDEQFHRLYTSPERLDEMGSIEIFFTNLLHFVANGFTGLAELVGPSVMMVIFFAGITLILVLFIAALIFFPTSWGRWIQQISEWVFTDWESPASLK